VVKELFMASVGPGIPLEQNYVFTVLGIQFWDPTLDQPITDGLTVTAQLQDTDYPLVTAFRTASGAYAFQGLPCLHDIEYPPGGVQAPASPQKTFTFVITVADVLDRFLPTLFAVDLPLSYPGLFLSNDSASPAVGARAYLFTAPTRAALPGIGVIRVALWDHDQNQAAAYAALRVSIGGQQWTGIADAQGRVQVQFPSPLLQSLSLGSPPGSGQGPTSSVNWPVQVSVLYEPAQQRFLLHGVPDVVWPWNSTPSLKSILDGQQPALVWQHEAGPPVSEWTGTLSYGTPLILRTTLSDPTQISSVLMISQSTSP
jgi:hypothetical protein